MSTAVAKLYHHVVSRSKISAVGAVRIKWKPVYIVGSIVFLALLGFYVVSVNQLTQGAYVIKSDVKKINALMAEQRSLQADFAENNFLASATQKAGALGFEKTTQVTYLPVSDSSLAEAK